MNGPETKEEVVKNGDINSDGEFQTVAPKSARRKEKLKEHREHIAEPHPYRHKEKQRLHRHGDIHDRPHKDKDHGHSTKDILREKEKDREKDKEKDSDVNLEENEPQQVKYVEAPLPAVNPWTKSKINTQPQNVQPQVAPANSVPAVATPAPAPAAPVSVLAPTPAEKPSEKEKRVIPSTVQKPKLIGKHQLLLLFQ